MRLLYAAPLTLLCTGCLGTPELPAPAAPQPHVVAVAVPTPPVQAVLPVATTAAPAVAGEPATTAALATDLGEATYYADRFDGRRTASGILFRNAEAYAAHRTYPFGTLLRVTNTRNDRSVIVQVVDRGPHGTSERQRRTIIDVSRSAAEALGFVAAGRAPVRVEVLEWGGTR